MVYNMTDYKRLKEDVNTLIVVARIYHEDLTSTEYNCLYGTKRVVMKDLLLEGSKLGRSIFDVLYNVPWYDYENKLQFYKGLLDLAERGNLNTLK